MDPDEAQAWHAAQRDQVSRANKTGVPVRKVMVAVKRISKEHIEKFPNFQEMLHNELTVIQKFNHKNIMYFFDIAHTSSNYYFVFELCSGGDLAKMIKEKSRLDEFEAQKIFK